METILEILHTRRASTSTNPAAANVTHVVGITNVITVVDTTVETQVETVAQTTENRQLVPTDLNRLVVAYP